jgi:hypothetical protein
LYNKAGGEFDSLRHSLVFSQENASEKNKPGWGNPSRVDPEHQNPESSESKPINSGLVHMSGKDIAPRCETMFYH